MRVKNAVWETIATRAIFALWGLVAVTFLTVTGCDEGINMTRPVVMEPTEPVEPTTNGEVKEPETPVVDPNPEETVEEPDDEVSEEVPEDPVPPMEPETPAVDPEVPDPEETVEDPTLPIGPEDIDINQNLQDFIGQVYVPNHRSYSPRADALPLSGVAVIPFLNNYIPFATFVKYLKFVIWAIAVLV